MEAYTRIQEDTKLKIQKGKHNYKKSPKERVTISYIETRLETLEKQWSTFCDTHTQIISEIKYDDLAKSAYHTKDVYDETEELYINYKTELKQALLMLRGNSDKTKQCDPSGSSEVEQSFNVKLPIISIPRFSGKYAEWTSFRDLFKSLIHNNKGLDDVQRLHYLKSHLSGEAEQLLRHVPITSSNYNMCWSQLEARYNNKRYLANCILQRFMNQKNVISENSNAIKELLDTTNECLSALTNLGIDINSWDVIIIYIISLKLDTESRKLWEVEISKSTNELPSLTEFVEFLDQRFYSLEFLDHKNYRSVNVRHNNISKVMHVTTTTSCIFCSENHKLCHCKRFANENTDARRNFVQTNKLCFNCLGSNHSVYNCRQSTSCHVCKKRHHSLLHPKPVSRTDSLTNGQSTTSVNHNVVQASFTPPTSQDEVSNIASCFSNVNSQVLLATALVKVESKSGTFFVRSLLDQGSQASFITEAAVQMLGLKKISHKSYISGLGSDQSVTLQSRWIVKINIQSRQDPSFSLIVKAHVLSKLTSLLPKKKIEVKVLSSQLPRKDLADPSFDTPSKIDLLLGAEVYGQILLNGVIKGPPGFPIAQHTTLGWILSGQIHSEINSYSLQHITSMHAHILDNNILKKFWELEEVTSFTTKTLTEDERRCEELFAKTTKRDDEGRYIVKLPFKSAKPECQFGNSYDVSLKRFHLLEKRLTANPELKTQYTEVINEYLTLGHMEKVINTDIMNPTAVYLPHHAVIRKDKKTTQVRVVFDASCSLSNNTSLNNDLMVGPTLQSDLRYIVMRWRCYPISLIADIVKMYRQVKISEDDVNFQRLLWRDEVDSKIEHYRLLRVTFGTSAAPYLAVRSLQQLSYDEGDHFPLAANRVLNDFYMDDFLSGCETIEEGLQLYQEMNELLSHGGFPLQKWTYSDDKLLQVIQEDEKESKEENFKFKSDPVMKILGLTWNRKNDNFYYTVQLPPIELPVTKRRVISDIARLYDPLGWIAPVITTAKAFIQRIWLSGIEWDDELPTQLMKEWLVYRDNLSHLTHFCLPRWINTSKNDSVMELQGFCDASNVAYAAVVYLRVVDEKGNVFVSLITSKSKVAPVKQISIPRLELCGAVLLTKLLLEVSEILNISKERIHAWTDSSVVLSWLSSHPTKWKTFVANRVSEILTAMDRSQWSHVKSDSNPADCASRGVNPCDFGIQELWKKGPSWLQEKIIHYNRGELINTNLEQKKEKIICNLFTQSEDIIANYSNLRKLIRIISYCKRLRNIKGRNTFKSWLTIEELNDALLTCIRLCQRANFLQDIENIKTRGKVNKKGRLTCLNPFLDRDDILRVGGRLSRSNLSDDIKYPILLPYKSHFTNLVIADAHRLTLHGGPQLMLNFLRTKYWIINAKILVRQYCRNCVVCIRHSGQINQQLMGQLPPARVNPCRPFYQSGVDYAGPISVRPTKGRGYHSTKGYVCLFICMATRAIHLEIVSDLSSEGFIAAFRRFVSRRGHCADLWSDNGTNFVGASKELKVLMDQQRSTVAKDIGDWLTMNGTDWHFIPPRAPNFGGLWEAGVKSTKHHLKRVIGTNTLTFEEMTTLLSQIEACLNSRPISKISNHPEDPYPLTPGHFLVGEPLVLVPDYKYEAVNISTLKRWHFTQRLVQDFWRRWSQEYLTQLHHRYKWTHQKPESNVGDIVLVKEDDLPPARWLYGIIVNKHVGPDNLTRVVSLRSKGSIIKRLVSKLIILPVTT